MSVLDDNTGLESAMADMYFKDACFVAQPSDIDAIWTSENSLATV